MELWDLYDKNRNLITKGHVKGDKIPKNCYHIVVHAWIKNNENKFLIAKRSENRPNNPLKYECIGGSVLSNEDSFDGILREIKEEVGLSLSKNDGKLIRTITGRIIEGIEFQDIADVYLFEYNGEILLENATTNEVCDIMWLDKAQIKELFDKGKFVNTLYYFFDLF